ncbi:MAG: glycoside hydrolase family 2 TIM barrel-domain containing protein [Rikenellaceae bacterium]
MIESWRKAVLLVATIIVASLSVSARDVLSLNENWRIFSTADGSGDQALNISLPDSWDSNSNYSANLTNANYLRTINVPPRWRDHRIYIRFYGIESVADLFVNGNHVGEHRGGATAFTYEITKFLKFGEDNVLMVMVSSSPRNDVLPTSVEHQIYGGINRNVELIITPKCSISPTFYGSDGIFVTTESVDDGVVKGNVRIYLSTLIACERGINVKIESRDGETLFDKRQDRVKIDGKIPLVVPFEIKGAEVWSPSNPALHTVTVSMIDGETTSDIVDVTTGFRTIQIAADGLAKGCVSINNTPLLMRGVTLYHDHPNGGGRMNNRSITEDMLIVNEIGANAIRSAIVPHDPYLYNLCDKEGIVVWVDTPLSRSSFLTDVAYYPTESFEQNGIKQMKEVIYQNYNHPSIIMWGLFSLLRPQGDNVVKYLEELNSVAKSADPSRPTVALSNQNGDINNVSDLIVWQQKMGWDRGKLSDIGIWSNQLHNKWSNFRSGVAYGEGGSIAHQIERSEIEADRAYNREGWFPEVRQSEMHETYASNLAADSLFWGVWLTSLFDYKAPRTHLGEKTTGLVTFDRDNRKDAFYLYRAMWNKDIATLHIADKRSRMLQDSLYTLRVYASHPEAPVAHIDGGSYEMEEVAPSQYLLRDISITRRSKIVVTQDELRDSITLLYNSPLRARE